MLATRMTARALRASANPSSFLSSTARISQRRIITTESITQTTSESILAAQRLHRPISPHLSIYQPQLTWYLSMFNRITGVILSGGLYIFGAAYVIAPYAGWHVDSAVIAKKVGDMSTASKVALKGAIALPFTFHCWNGVRHLVWDTARELTVRGVYRTGYVVLGLTAVSTVGLMFY